MHKNVAVSLDRFDTARNYWLEKLSGDLAAINLVTDLAGFGRDEPADYSIDLGKEESQKLVQMAKNNRLSLYIFLLAAFKILLHKYTGQQDIVVVSPVYNVSPQEYNRFVALRDWLEPGWTFKELLMKVKQTVVEGYKNQFYPLEKVIELIVPGSGRSLFRVVLQLEDIHRPESGVDPLTGLADVENYLVLTVKQGEPGLTFALRCNAALFASDTMAKLLDRYRYILSRVLNDVELTIGDIELVTPAERREVLAVFNRTAAPYPGHTTIHGLFDRQAHRVPGRAAVVFEDRHLSCGGLLEGAERLALKLREKGVKPKTIVAIMTRRGPEMITGLLAILKSGGAYLPIDPEYPPKRISRMMADGGVDLLLANRQFQGKFTFKGEWLDLEEEGLAVPGDLNLPNPNADNAHHSQNPAYIIFTSGSTGKPKGVVVAHRSIVNTLCWRQDYYDFGEGDAVLQIPSFAFDSSVEDIFTPLIGGARLVMVSLKKLFDLESLKGIIKGNRISHFLIVPGFYQTLLNEIHPYLGGLKSVTIAGESFTLSLVREHFRRLPDVRLVNEYGPTENSVCSTVFEFSGRDDRVLIGQPIPNTGCWIVNRSGQLSPVGVAGELCLGGRGLAMGYLNRPDLTGQRFVENPFVPGQKMYRSGDLARWRPDGSLEFLGRIDHQVKIRGFRVELEEIENRLLSLEQIREAVVIARESEDHNRHLYAFIVTQPSAKEAASWSSDLREYLSAELPGYMMPSHFIQVEKMPLTPNGKIDRQALESLAVPPDSGSTYEPPSNELEKKIVDVWKDVLNLERVGIHDNFFELGGTSFHIIKINQRLRQLFQLDVPVVDMFRKTTVHSFADYLSDEATELRDRAAAFARGRRDRVEQFQRRRGLRDV
jgi:amino acid adenylation domain-containing protein